MGKQVVAIVGTYRKGKVIDTAVDEILKGAEASGAQTLKIDLMDKHIEFCKNCRACTQEKALGTPGKCIQEDDMAAILDEISSADALVLASPMNVGRVTAVMNNGRNIGVISLFIFVPWVIQWLSPRPAPRQNHSRPADGIFYACVRGNGGVAPQFLPYG